MKKFSKAEFSRKLDKTKQTRSKGYEEEIVKE